MMKRLAIWALLLVLMVGTAEALVGSRRVVLSGGGCGTTCLGVNGLSNVTATNLSKWRAARSLVANGVRNSIVNLVGDSTTAGYGTTGNTSNATDAMPGQLAPLINVNASISSWIGACKQSGGACSTTPMTDSRRSVGNFISGDGMMGGYAYLSNTVTGPLTYTPTNQVDTFVVYWINLAAAVMNVTIDGTSAGSITETTAFTLGHTTFTATLGNHTIGFLPNAAIYANVALTIAYNSTLKEVTLLNSGNGGTAVSAWDTAAGPYSYGQMEPALAPDLTIIELTTNDINAGTAIATYETSLQHIVNYAISSGGSVVLSTGVPDGSFTPTQQIPYINAVQQVAIANGLPFLNLYQTWQTWAIANAKGWMFDAFHPTSLGYGAQAATLAKLLNN